MAQFDIVGPDGNVIVEQGQRINALRVKRILNFRYDQAAVPDEYLYERIIGEDIVVGDEVLVRANTLIDHEILVNLLKKMFNHLRFYSRMISIMVHISLIRYAPIQL